MLIYQEYFSFLPYLIWYKKNKNISRSHILKLPNQETFRFTYYSAADKIESKFLIRTRNCFELILIQFWIRR